MEEQAAVRKVNGVVNFVYWLGKPAMVRNEEIEAIRVFLDGHSNVHLEKISININDTVRINHGPFLHQEGQVMEILGSHVKVALPSLGFSLVATVNKIGIERVNVNPSLTNVD